MTKQITLEEALKIVTFEHDGDGTWHVACVQGNVYGNVWGNVQGSVWGTITDRKWQYVETPKEKLQRLIKETGNQELIDAFNQLEDN